MRLYCPCGDFHQKIFSELLGLVFMNCQRAPPSLSQISHETSNSYAICAL